MKLPHFLHCISYLTEYVCSSMLSHFPLVTLSLGQIYPIDINTDKTYTYRLNVPVFFFKTAMAAPRCMLFWGFWTYAPFPKELLGLWMESFWICRLICEEFATLKYLAFQSLNTFFYYLVQFSSFAQSCLTLCDPMNRSTPGLPVHHQLPEFTQTHVHRVSDAII